MSQTVVDQQIIGSTPNQTVAGVMSGGAPWMTRRASVTISSSGAVNGVIKGLLIPGATPTVGPVTDVAVSLVCGGSGGTIAATTKSFPLNSKGNAKINDTIKLPSSCIAPVLLVQVTGLTSGPLSTPGPFIALTGFNTSGGAESASESPGDTSGNQ
ncbi:MAG TPA: hypothetical protein VEZ90_20015 [Blastocatellia bacterium]|nr:hypothetical protein [Blastocatellia bacterium]